MARGRTVKPEFFRDKTIARLGARVALVYQALWCWADDGGVCRIEPDLLKGEAFARWSEYTVSVLTECLVSLHGVGRIKPYAVGDELYAEIPTLAKHSRINRPSQFRLPRDGQPVSDIQAWVSGQYTHGALTEGSRPVLPLAITSPKTITTKAAAADELRASDYTTNCVVMANRSADQRWPGGATMRRDVEQERGIASAWERDGIPLDLVLVTIAKKTAQMPTTGRRPSSLKYFDGAVREAWEREQVGKTPARVVGTVKPSPFYEAQPDEESVA